MNPRGACLALVLSLAVVGCRGHEGDDPGECSDEADNDRNGKFDCDDPGCKGSPACDNEQTDPTVPVGECGDGFVEVGVEACDGDGAGVPGETATCDVDCTDAECGDGQVNATAGEECDDGTPNGIDHCTQCAKAPTVVIAGGTLVFDTDAGTLDGVDQPGWDASTATWYVDSFTVEAGAVLDLQGSQALTIDAAEDVQIDGQVELAGEDGGSPAQFVFCDTAGPGGAPGPGGFAGGAGAGNGGSGTRDGLDGDGPVAGQSGAGGEASAVTDTVNAAAGGGGGGNFTPGFTGMGNAPAGTYGGNGGPTLTTLPPLIGGSGGGGGSVEADSAVGATLQAVDDEGAGGGGGGGALAVFSRTSILVTGAIDASGGAGGDDLGCSEMIGCGGGGAGGTVWLVAPSVAVTGTVDVSGGLGGVTTLPGSYAGNGGDGGSGRLEIELD